MTARSARRVTVEFAAAGPADAASGRPAPDAEDRSAPTGVRNGRARWPAPTSLGLCSLGAAVAGYLTYAHFTAAAVLACPDTGVINCAKVTTSSYSEVLGIPVAVAGLAFFIAMGAFCTPAAWRSRRPWLRAGRVGAATAGVAMVVWLVYVELFRLNAICLYCSAVHVLTFLLFATVLAATATTSDVAGGADPETAEEG